MHIFKLFIKNRKCRQCAEFIYDRRHQAGGSGSGETKLLDLNSMTFENPSFNFNIQAPTQGNAQAFDFDINHTNHPSRILEDASADLN